MMCSRRDSNRTPADMIALLARGAKRDGTTEEEFVAQFKPTLQELARKIYQEAQ